LEETMSKRIAAFVILAAACLPTPPANAAGGPRSTEAAAQTQTHLAAAPARAREPFGIVVPPPQPRSRAGIVPTLDVTAKPFVHTHRVAADFAFELEVPLLVEAVESPLFPWKATPTLIPQTRPVRSAVAVLEDDCGHYIKRALSSSGAVTIDWSPAGCANATLTIWSVAPGDGRRVGVGRWIHGAVSTFSELSTSSADYRPYSFVRSFQIDDAEKNGGPGLDLGTVTVPFEDDASRGFFIMDNVQTALDYYESLPGVEASELPKVNVVHTESLLPDGVDCDEWDSDLRYALYSYSKDPGFISIPWDCNDLGRDGHAHVHETSHYFQRHFLRQNPDYGRFGEGMANLQAALIRKTQWITTAGAGLLENLDVNSRMVCWDGTDVALEPNEDGELVPVRIDDVEDLEACEDDGHASVFPQAAAWDPALNNAGWFQRIVWDLVDPDATEPEAITEFLVPGASPGDCDDCDAGEFDDVEGEGFNVDPAALALNDVLIHYLGGSRASGENDAYEDRGLEGLDLADLVDGFVCRGHLSPDQANAIVADAMGLEFDAAGGPESCPHPSD
jgi:hypothetical protein